MGGNEGNENLPARLRVRGVSSLEDRVKLNDWLNKQ